MNRIVDDQITLIPYYRNDDISLLWYQDSEICKQVDNTDQIYSLTKLHKMYDYLTSHGSCYYIQYKGVLVGDVVGSVYEWNNIKTKDFPLFRDDCFFTDDTVMICAVAEAIMIGG